MQTNGQAPETAWPRLLALLSEAAAISAVLYYFGWIRTEATFARFGVNLSLLELATTDYILRSINSAFPPLIGLGVVLVALTAAHRRWVVPALSVEPTRRAHRVTRAAIRVVTAVCGLGLALAGLGVIAQDTVGKPLGWWLPAILVVGSAGLMYVGSAVGATTPVRSVVLPALAVFGGLWLVTVHAQHTGTEFGDRFVAALPRQPEVVLYSAERLAIAGPGVDVAPIAQEGTRFKYRYTGLRMLIHTRDRYFLVASEWQRGRDATYVVRAADDTRIDIIAR
ncbi:MAG: hypothetical protein HOY78_37040 [Saccharothrix sp.]|nr:hypothetical protein [Saccharothrix sp.]